MRPLFASVVLLGLSALTGCSRSSSQSPFASGGGCTTYPPVTGTATVSRIEPAVAFGPKAGDQPCSHVFFDWIGPEPDRFPNMDNFFATPACIASTNLHAGSSFALTREDLKTGTCTPSRHVILDPAVAACAKACGGE